jgi:enediyne core biosynthesis thioesterase
MQGVSEASSGTDQTLKAYEYRHVVTFEETNLVGNVYYVHYLRWQGCCREMFLRDHALEVLPALQNEFCMVTARCSCDYLAELFALDEVVLRMRLVEIVRNRITFGFDYWRCEKGKEHLVASGEQQVACMSRQGKMLVPTAIPEPLLHALQPYSFSER